MRRFIMYSLGWGGGGLGVGGETKTHIFFLKESVSLFLPSHSDILVKAQEGKQQRGEHTEKSH